MAPGSCCGLSQTSRGLAPALSVLLWICLSAGALAQEVTLPDSPDTPSTGGSLPRVLGSELRRYVADTGAILSSPLHWDRGSWLEAAGAVASIALLEGEDARIDIAFQRNRSSQTNSFSRTVTPLGSYAGVGISFAALGGGLLLRNPELRDTGRDAVEAELIAAGIVTPILKKVFGRERPIQGSDADEYRAFSQNASFPSGHATEAFAVASVVAARSNGWVVPVVAYTLASGVGLARMNDRAHFASDVVAGALIGTAIGRSVVHRHSPEGGTATSWSLVPVSSRQGFGIGIRLETSHGS
jgi:membrane-associated phospholipid phosphatase